MAKEIAGFIKLQIKGGAANPSPPVGPAEPFFLHKLEQQDSFQTSTTLHSSKRKKQEEET